jgi:hypothetical protein
MMILFRFLFPRAAEVEDLRASCQYWRERGENLSTTLDGVRKLRDQLEADLLAERQRADAARTWAAQLLPAERDEVLRAFSGVGRDNQLLIAVRALVENARSEASELALAPEMARSPGEAAHSAGGAYWLELLANRIQTAWLESRQGTSAVR